MPKKEIEVNGRQVLFCQAEAFPKTILRLGLTYKMTLKQKSLQINDLQANFCGPDGTRTRDLRRDRAAF
jgi:hypothetical protein